MIGLLLIYVLVIHYLADFVAQTSEQALNKSISINALLDHTSTYSAIVAMLSVPIFIAFDTTDVGLLIVKVCAFYTITFFAHSITDYFTSRWSKKYFSKQEYSNGFRVVGFDQILHYIQLYYTYKLLTW